MAGWRRTPALSRTTPTSSATSRWHACSADSPASMNPATMETRVACHWLWRASRSRSSWSVMATITHGSIRGKARAPHAGQILLAPARSGHGGGGASLADGRLQMPAGQRYRCRQGVVLRRIHVPPSQGFAVQGSHAVARTRACRRTGRAECPRGGDRPLPRAASGGRPARRRFPGHPPQGRRRPATMRRYHPRRAGRVPDPGRTARSSGSSWFHSRLQRRIDE